MTSHLEIRSDDGSWDCYFCWQRSSSRAGRGISERWLATAPATPHGPPAFQPPLLTVFADAAEADGLGDGFGATRQA